MITIWVVVAVVVGGGEGKKMYHSPFIHQTLLGVLFMVYPYSSQQIYEVYILLLLILLMKKQTFKETSNLFQVTHLVGRLPASLLEQQTSVLPPKLVCLQGTLSAHAGPVLIFKGQGKYIYRSALHPIAVAPSQQCIHTSLGVVECCQGKSIQLNFFNLKLQFELFCKQICY